MIKSSEASKFSSDDSGEHLSCAERLRGGGLSDDSSFSGNDTRDTRSKSEDRMANVFQKIEMIESKIKFLMRKVSAASESKYDPVEQKARTVLKQEIKKYQKKLEKCEQKRKRYEREPRLMSYKYKAEHSTTSSSHAVDSHIASQESKKEVDTKHSQRAVVSKRRRRADISKPAAELNENPGPAKNVLEMVKFKKRASGQDDEDLRFAEGPSNATFGAPWQSDTGFDEDLMCQKMHQAAFKKFSLEKMYFIYSRALTGRYYHSGLFQYFPVTKNKTAVAEVRLKMPLGPYNHQRGPQREIRFQRMDPLHKCLMVYYTYRTEQQLVDRIISEAWTQFYPKRFYMSFDHCVDITWKNLPSLDKGGKAPRWHIPNNYSYKKEWGQHVCVICRPVAIQIPRGMKLKHWTASYPSYCDVNVGETDWDNTEWLTLQVRYKWGNYPIFSPTTKYNDRKRDFSNCFWILDLMPYGAEDMGVYSLSHFFAFFGELAPPYARYPRMTRRGKNIVANYKGWRCQGFNVKRLENLKAENNQFKEDYEKWGKVNRHWDIASKRRS